MTGETTSTGNGGCRCGKVRFAVSGVPLFTGACHCTGCQKMSSSAFSLTSTYPADAFELVQGKTVIGGLHGEVHHHFCEHCMSWMFTRVEAMDWFVNVRTTLLDTPPAEPPFVESYTSEALPWALTGAKHSFEKFPPEDSYSGLIEEFAASHR